MGILSKLFGGGEQEESAFQIPWLSEVRGTSLELPESRILISDAAGIAASDIAQIQEACRHLGRSLVLVTPGVDASVIRLLGGTDLVAVKATELPDQPLPALLEDLAVVTGGCGLFKCLGFGLSFPDTLRQSAGSQIFIPDRAWQDLSVNELGRARRVTVGPDGTAFYFRGCGNQQSLHARAEHILRAESSPGRAERLCRLGFTADSRVAGARVAGLPQSEYRIEFGLGLASPYFINDVRSYSSVVQHAQVAIFGEPLTGLQVLVRLLGFAARSGRSLLLVAPSISDEAMALCVVNKLRGVVQCVVAVPLSQSEPTASLPGELARRTNGAVLSQSHASWTQGDDAIAELWDSLGSVGEAQVTFGGMGLKPAPSEGKPPKPRDSAPIRHESRETAAARATILVENRIVSLQLSEGRLHLIGEFSGNLDFLLTFSDPVPAEVVLRNLRVRMPGQRKLVDVAGSRTIAYGIEVTVYSGLSPSGQDIRSHEAPTCAEVFWLEHSKKEPIAQLTVKPVP